jgi:peptidoglycan/LPS O-acetylase OafA/YrhL
MARGVVTVAHRRLRQPNPDARQASGPPVATPPSASRLPGIEGLRAIAASSILVYHCWFYGSPDGSPPSLGPLTGILPHLTLGVILFFSLSGFLLYRPLAAAAMRATPGPSIRRYLRNRALRILPAYWVILLLAGVLMQAALVRKGSYSLELGSLAGQPATLLGNLALVQSYYPRTLLTGIGPAWSLVVEVAFYVTLPFLAAGAAFLARRTASRRRRRAAMLLPPLVMLGIGLLGKLMVHLVGIQVGAGSGWGPDWYSVLARSYLANADLFAFGMALGVLYVDVEDGLVHLPAWWRYAAAAGAGAVAVAAIRVTSNTTGIGTAGYDVLMAIPCSLVLAAVVVPDTRPSRRRLRSLLDSRPLVSVGLASYSLFLWHEPLEHWLREHGLTLPGAAGFVVNLMVVAVLAGVLSWLTYRFVELPAMSRRRQREPSEAMSRGQAQAAP